MEPSATHAPIAVFAYNRADRLRGMIESLCRCDGFDASPVTIFVDGAKRESDQPAVDEVRTYVAGLGLPNVRHVFASSNSGLRQAVFGGVTALCREYGRAIVLEDDLILSPIALRYFNEGLTRYADHADVWSIVGYAYDAPDLRAANRTVALPFAHPWGWATWGRAWERFDLDSRPAPADLDSESFRAAFDMNGLYPFTAQLRNSISGNVNSWFIHWYYTVFQHGGRSIFPPRRVLDNHGIGRGTHGGSFNPHEILVKRPPLLTELPEFGDAMNVDYAVLDMLKNSWELRVQRAIARAGAVKRGLPRLR